RKQFVGQMRIENAIEKIMLLRILSRDLPLLQARPGPRQQALIRIQRRYAPLKVRGEYIRQPGLARLQARIEDAVMALKIDALAPPSYDLSAAAMGSRHPSQLQRLQIHHIQCLPILIRAVEYHLLPDEGIVVKIK